MYRIFLPYSGPQEDEALRLADHLAGSIDAQVDATFLSRTLHPLTELEQGGFDHIRSTEGLATANEFLEAFYRGQHKAKAEAARESYGRMLAGIDSRGRFSWHQHDDVFQETQPIVTREAVLHDLTMASFRVNPAIYDELVEDALLGTGRPVLFVAQAQPRAGELTVVIAWKPAAPTIHAVTAAMPLIQAASKCFVVAIDEGDQMPEPSAGEFARHLAASGATVEAVVLKDTRQSAQYVLEKYCEDVRADVLVMGAYSRSRLKQYIFGGFTKHFLSRRSCTVLMAA